MSRSLLCAALLLLAICTPHAFAEAPPLSEEAAGEVAPALPAAEASDGPGTQSIKLGEKISLDHLGPAVVNVDGTLGRITNWELLSKAKQETTRLRLAKRNQERLAALKAGAAAGAPSSSNAPDALAEGYEAEGYEGDVDDIEVPKDMDDLLKLSPADRLRATHKIAALAKARLSGDKFENVQRHLAKLREHLESGTFDKRGGRDDGKDGLRYNKLEALRKLAADMKAGKVKVGQIKQERPAQVEVEATPAAPSPPPAPSHGPGHGYRPRAPPPIPTAEELRAAIAEAQAAKAAKLPAEETLAVDDDVVGVAELLEEWAMDSSPLDSDYPDHAPSTFRYEPAPAPEPAPEADRTEL